MTSKWFCSWYQCQGRCGEGWQRRQVDCIDHDGEPGDKCDPESRPADARRCDMNCEEELATHDGETSVANPYS
ncbi:hypothetical protein DPMN_048622 [Dreissena polymorpha]|uniref:Uncharacterized protein n=1 Tax=Dreissena polymorpha TaxID=45954 RepID=A0A9D4I328_DREPO|nr:hypothetical protein DPMN_048622 [Dreissena polymorpha]